MEQIQQPFSLFRLQHEVNIRHESLFLSEVDFWTSGNNDFSLTCFQFSPSQLCLIFVSLNLLITHLFVKQIKNYGQIERKQVY